MKKATKGMPYSDRLMRFVERIPESTCWYWIGGIRKDGYGCFRYQGKTQLAHRSAYRILVGEIPEGLDLDHLCRERSCVNPSHLQPVTRRENTLRSPIALAAKYANRTHCKCGRELIFLGSYGGGCRGCLVCTPAKMKDYFNHYDKYRRRRKVGA